MPLKDSLKSLTYRLAARILHGTQFQHVAAELVAHRQGFTPACFSPSPPTLEVHCPHFVGALRFGVWGSAFGGRGLGGSRFGVLLTSVLFSSFCLLRVWSPRSRCHFTAPTERAPSSSRGSASNGPAAGGIAAGLEGCGPRSRGSPDIKPSSRRRWSHNRIVDVGISSLFTGQTQGSLWLRVRKECGRDR
jgi:hypothetical protein